MKQVSTRIQCYDYEPIHDDATVCPFSDPFHVYLRTHLQDTPHICGTQLI